MTTRERREAKAERLRTWADNRDEKAAAVLNHNRTYTGDIAFNTQPGHIPLRARVIRQNDRAIESMQKAGGMRSRASGIEAQLASSIYSDDPDAVEALAARIAELEAERDRIKAYNASCRKAAKTGGTGDLSLLDDRQRDAIATLARVCSYQVGTGGSFPSYHLTNLSANIKRNRDRIADVEKRRARSEATEQAGGILVEQLGHGYARVTFAEKPDRSTITALKDAGYHWGQGSWTGQADHLPAEVQP